MDLSKKERLLLFNQYEILKHINPEETKEYEINQDILFYGYKNEYDSLVNNFFEDTSIEVSSFVLDVLQMYRCINNSYYNLSDDEKEEYKKLPTSFEGFDGNEETDYYMYACFVLEKKGEYEESYQDGKIDTNSHWNKVSKYANMLNRWKEVRSGRYDTLSLENIRYIVQK